MLRKPRPALRKLALLDLRGDPGSAMLFFFVTTIGLTALITVGSFAEALKGSLASQSLQLLGADCMVVSREKPPTDLAPRLFSIGEDRAREVSFRSMAVFPEIDNRRLVQVRAIEAKFPFYGDFETEPPGAKSSLENGRFALIDDALMKQLGIQAGGTVSLGELEFRVAGSVKKVPGESIIRALVAPRVYVSLREIEGSSLLGFGAVASYRWYFRTSAARPFNRSALQHELETNRLELQTAEQRLKSVAETIGAVEPYLKLFALVAFALGGLGMGSALQVFLRRKQRSTAVLRALGTTRLDMFKLTIFQVGVISAASFACALGASMGVLSGLTEALQEFAPLPFAAQISAFIAAAALAVTLSLTMLLGSISILKLCAISPMAALTSLGDEQLAGNASFRVRFILSASGAALLIFSLWMFMGREVLGLSLGLGCLAVFVLLIGGAKALLMLIGLFHGMRLPFTVRQGLLNMRRPYNQTTSIIVCLGSVLLVFLTIAYLEHSFARALSSSENGNRPNAVMIDIQPDQIEGLRAALHARHLPALEETPVVSMRLVEVKGKKASELLKEDRYPRWTLIREYRSTYRSRLTDSEELVDGIFSESSRAGSPVQVSVEEGLAEKLGLELNDTLEFDVQGARIKAFVGSIRRVDWKRIKPNFFFVFPTGILEEAPRFYLATTRTASAQALNDLQRELGRSFRNVSLIDLSLVSSTVDSVVQNISFIVKLMSGFALLSSIVVLAGAVLTTRGERLRELALLKTLGASRAQARAVVLYEYLSLGLLSSLFGIALAFPAAWALTRYLFKIRLVWSPVPTVAGPAGVSLLILLLTGSMTKFVYSRSALSALKEE